MYIESIRLNNYIGVYNGMGLDEVHINFTTRNKVNLILGGNGSGKSTLMEALHPFSNGDRDKIIMANKKGFKEIVYVHDNMRYKIYHEYTPNKTGHNVKSYIARALNNEDYTELNPNGNVGSFEDIVKQELCIDKLGMKLAKLSSTSNSIVGMTNAERKKYMNDIQPSLEIMSDLNKRMTEKHRDVKNQLTRVSAKIDDIGGAGVATVNLDLIDRRISELESSKLENSTERANVISQYKAYGTTIPQLESDINTLTAEIRKYNIELDVIRNKKFKSNVNMSNDEINEYIKNSNDEIVRLDDKRKNLEEKRDMYINQSNELYKSITTKQATLDNMTSGGSIDDCIKLIELNNEELHNIDKYNSSLSKEFDTSIDSRYVLSAENALGNLSDKISDFYATIEYGDRELNDLHKSDVWIEQQYHDTLIDIADAENEEIRVKNKLVELHRLENMSSILKDRPKDCNIDCCPFIKSAVDININEVLSDIESNTSCLEDIQKRIIHNKEELDYYIKLKNSKQSFNRIITQSIGVYSSVNKLPKSIIGILEDTQKLSSNIISGDFILQYNMGELIEILGSRERAKYLTEKNEELNSRLKMMQEKQDILEVYRTEIASANNIITSNNEKIMNLNNTIQNIVDEKIKLQISIDMLHDHFSLNLSEESYVKALTLAEESLKTANSTLPILNNLKAKTITLNNILGNIDVELSNNKNKRDDLIYKVKALDSYQKEKEQLEERYQRVSILKDMTSSTKGIPLVFTEIYIKETRRIANKLLNIILQDEYELMPFVIDDKTFRIPCKRGYDKQNEDVGTMSAGEKAIIALVLSVALLIQCGTTYNILLLDEVDGPLDVEKKSKYIQVLESIMDLLDIEQIMAISHSNEFDSYSTNIIALNGAEMNKINESDIIFKL